MPSTSEKQRRFMGAELGRAEHGEATKTHMSVKQLKEFARKPIRPSGRGKARR
jgi:hypothetical protein